jgi:hypothetical protein
MNLLVVIMGMTETMEVDELISDNESHAEMKAEITSDVVFWQKS